MGQLQGVTVDIEGVITQTDFEVIEIIDDSNPYPTLLGIDWATDMNEVINLKRWKMTFKKKSLRVTILLDLDEGVWYTELVHNEESDNELDCIYQIIAQDRGRVNSSADEKFSWEHDSSCTSDSDEEIERWKNRLQEVTTLNYNMMTRSLQRVTTKVRQWPAENGTTSEGKIINLGTLIMAQK